MKDITNPKYFSIQITERFIIACDSIIGKNGSAKVTAGELAETVGMSSSNLIRLRNSTGDHNVTIEAVGRLCHHYGISAYWIITGQGDINSNDEILNAYKTLGARINDIEKVAREINSLTNTIKKGTRLKPNSNKTPGKKSFLR